MELWLLLRHGVSATINSNWLLQCNGSVLVFRWWSDEMRLFDGKCCLFSDDWKTLVQFKRLEIKSWKTLVKNCWSVMTWIWHRVNVDDDAKSMDDGGTSTWRKTISLPACNSRNAHKLLPTKTKQFEWRLAKIWSRVTLETQNYPNGNFTQNSSIVKL